MSQNEIVETLVLSSDVTWTYGIRLVSSSGTRIHTEAGKVFVEAPADAFRRWLQGADLEWRHEHNNPQLLVLIEKDLKPHRN